MVAMVRFLARTALYLLANSLGLIAAAVLLDGFTLDPVGFVVSVLVFTAVETLLGPFVVKMAIQYAPALRGGIALVTTFVADRAVRRLGVRPRRGDPSADGPLQEGAQRGPQRLTQPALTAGSGAPAPPATGSAG